MRASPTEKACFNIGTVGLSQSYICSFIIGLRIDDRPILDEIKTTLGLGRITVKKQAGGNAAPQAWYAVIRKAECAQLVEVFDAFPLRAKKAHDFAIWRQAVAEWHRHTNRGPLRGRASRDWSPMAALQQELRNGRKYVATEQE